MPVLAALAPKPCALAVQRAPAQTGRSARLTVANALHQRQKPAEKQDGWASRVARLCGVAAAASVLLAGGPADAREKVAEFATSGLLFRDTVKIIELNDDKGKLAGPIVPRRQRWLPAGSPVLVPLPDPLCLQWTALSFT